MRNGCVGVDKSNFMDNGNHYHKVDLQIHSPRDTNWAGGAAVSEDDRERYAAEFIKQCRSADLDAVAITDHHDLVFFEYIKKAAENELDESGNAIPLKDQIIIFPGVEITLHTPPIQGLLILDADFPPVLFATILGALSIVQADKSESKTSPTVPIPTQNISGINDIYEKLDGIDSVKGRYIFLPHVSSGGHKTLMRHGFHESYATMKSCGGYLDGVYDDSDVGYTKILNGDVEAWGNKSIAVVQTSDFRGDKKLKETGVATWIKWKVPTAEALRQAFLAKESRITLSEPDVPNIFIEKIDVTNSTFLAKFQLDLNPQLNSIIGGRGTGKSSVLEYLRWALCDQTESFGDDEIYSEIERKRNSLIQKTLKEVNGEVRVFFSLNGTRHIVKRNPNSEDVLLKIGNGEFESVRPDFVRELLPIQAYSQKQLSSVSISTQELKRFIEQPISKELQLLDAKINVSNKDVRDAYDILIKNKRTAFELSKLVLEKDSLDKQISELQKGLKGITEEDRLVINRAKLYANENGRFKEVIEEYKVIMEAIESLGQIVGNYDGLETPELDLENNDLIDIIEQERKRHYLALSEAVESLKSSHESSSALIDKTHSDWREKRDDFKSLYTQVKDKSTSSKQTLQSIKELENKQEKLDQSIKEKKVSINKSEIDESEFHKKLDTFVDLQQNRLEIMRSSIDDFTALSDGYIRADYDDSINVKSLTSQVKDIFSSRSLNIQTARIEKLVEVIAKSENPIKQWREFLGEIQNLSEFSLTPTAQTSLPSTPILSEATFTDAGRRKIAEELGADGFVAIANLKLEFLPNFLYRTNNEMEDEVPFEDASAGQQATALINVLLNQGGFPLIIDQPEDDIDNRALEKIIEKLWKTKTTRQVIFSSHNANIVVNGDSELVVCCDYNESSKRTMGKIKYEGSIDERDIREEITTVMEGGERAFKLRKEKYGF